MEQQDIDIRYTRILDISYVRRWLNHPEVLKWFPMRKREEIEQALSCWMAFCKYGASLTALIDGVPCGIATLFLPPYKKLSHHCLFKICVDPAYQRKGVGSSLIKNIKHLASTHFKMEVIYAEVFDGNPLIELLMRFDFKVFARQSYYVKTDEGPCGRVMLEVNLKGEVDGR